MVTDDVTGGQTLHLAGLDIGLTDIVSLSRPHPGLEKERRRVEGGGLGEGS